MVSGCLDLALGSLDLVPWLPGCWTWFHGCLMKITGFYDSLRGSLDVVPSLPGKSHSMPAGSLLGSLDLVAWIRFLVAWIRFLVSLTWFRRLSWRWFSGSLLLYLVARSWSLAVWNYFWLPGVSFCFLAVGSLAIITRQELLRSIVAGMGE